jgi:hypothetical protein
MLNDAVNQDLYVIDGGKIASVPRIQNPGFERRLHDSKMWWRGKKIR